MKGFRPVCLLILAGAISILAPSQTAIDAPKTDPAAHEHKATIEGLVRDIACPIQNLEANATHLNMKCLRACAKTGSPLVILTKDGELFVPISDKMPDQDQRQTLLPFLGKYVRAGGTVYERKGTHAIAIHIIEEVKNVHLIFEDQ
ncbi:MAG: hypothetical protein JOZ14_19680 [Acidobacteria bacterium]|nr:hypothetical protein [Acidobacteriota bacterium]